VISTALWGMLVSEQDIRSIGSPAITVISNTYHRNSERATVTISKNTDGKYYASILVDDGIVKF